MVDPEKQQSNSERNIVDLDRVDQANADGVEDSIPLQASSPGVEISATTTHSISGCSRDNTCSSNEIRLPERLTDILLDAGDEDLLLQQSDREDTVMQWLRALDMQFMGACRADERLKPLLKLNVSSGGAEDWLLAYLSQHFEPSEVGLLARCLCIPLVSIRVGRINKQGTLLCPTAIRGNLNLTLLPTSDLRISFIGDDGRRERLLTLSSYLQCSAMTIEEIAADKSGRSFLINIPDGETFYFWCSEKSKLLGIELLEKMKDLLKRKPSLAELSGISESRLDSFVSHLRAYLVGSAVANTQASSVVSTIFSLETVSDSAELCQHSQSLSTSSRPSRSRHYSSQGEKPNSLYQSGLSPRSSSFKGGFPRSLSSLRIATREKFRPCGDGSVACVDNLALSSSGPGDASSSNLSEVNKLPEASVTCLFPPSSFMESLGKSADPCFLGSASRVPCIDSPIFSPYYCLCPPVVSTLQFTVAPPQLPISPTESLPLPTLSSLLPVPTPPGLLAPKPTLSLAEVPSIDFPPLLPEPLVRLPLSMPVPQHIPTFTPLMCDPIVHIPVIDVCSSGQGYLVSAGPSISTSIPPLHPKIVSPLIPETNTVVEQSARETLRLLISSSSQANPQLLDVLPSVLTDGDEKRTMFAAGSRGLYSGARDVGAVSMFAAGSRGFYSAARDVDAVTNSKAAMSLVSLTERSTGCSMKRCISKAEEVDNLHKSGAPGGESCSDDEGFISSNLRKERTD